MIYSIIIFCHLNTLPVLYIIIYMMDTQIRILFPHSLFDKNMTCPLNHHTT